MKQLGNLAVVCAAKKDVLLQIHNGVVSDDKIKIGIFFAALIAFSNL